MDLVILESFLKQVLCQGRSPENFFKVHLRESLLLIDICTAVIFVARTGEAKDLDKKTRFSCTENDLVVTVGTGSKNIPWKDKVSFISIALKTIQFAFKLMAIKKLSFEVDNSFSLSVGSLNLIQEVIALYSGQSIVNITEGLLRNRIQACLAAIPHYPPGRELKHSCCRLHESIVSMIMDRDAINLMLFPGSDEKSQETWTSLTRTYRKPLVKLPLTEIQLNRLVEGMKWSCRQVDNLWLLDKLLSSASKNAARFGVIRKSLETYPLIDSVEIFFTSGVCSNEVARKISDISKFFIQNDMIVPTERVDQLLEHLWEHKKLFPELMSLIMLLSSSSYSVTRKWIKRLLVEATEENIVQYVIANISTIDCESLDLVMPIFSKEIYSKKLIRLLSDLTCLETFKSNLLEYLSKQRWLASISYSHLLTLAPVLVILYTKCQAKSERLSSMLFQMIFRDFGTMEVDQTDIVSLTWLIIKLDNENDGELATLVNRFVQHLSTASELDALMDVPLALARKSPKILAYCLSVFGIDGSARKVYQQFSNAFDMKVTRLLQVAPEERFPAVSFAAAGYYLARFPRLHMNNFENYNSTTISIPRYYFSVNSKLMGTLYEAALFYNPQIGWNSLNPGYFECELVEDCFRDSFFDLEIEIQYFDMTNLMIVIALAPDDKNEARESELECHIEGILKKAKSTNFDVEFDGGTFKDHVPLYVVEQWPVLSHLKTFSSSDFSLRIPAALLPTSRHHRILHRLLTGRPLVHPSLRNFDIAVYVEAIWIELFLGNEKAVRDTISNAIHVIQEYDRNASKLAMEPIRYWMFLEKIFEICPMILMKNAILDPIIEKLAFEACRVLRDEGFRNFHKKLSKEHRSFIIDRLERMCKY